MKRSLAYGIIAVLLTGMPSYSALAPGRYARTLTFDRVPGNYEIYVSTAAARGGQKPLVLMLLGNKFDNLDRTHWKDYADTNGFFLAGVQPSSPLAGAGMWNEGSGRGGAETLNHVGYISAVIDAIAGEVPIDLKRVYAAGFSNSGGMALRLGVDLANRMAAVGTVSSAYWMGDKAGARPVPAIYIWGTSDEENPWDGGGSSGAVKPPIWQNIADWVKMLGCPTTPVTSKVQGIRTDLYEPCSAAMTFKFMAIDNMGHFYPDGSNAARSGSATGHVAEEWLWPFFASYPRETTSALPYVDNNGLRCPMTAVRPAIRILTSSGHAPSTLRGTIFNIRGCSIAHPVRMGIYIRSEFETVSH